MAATHAHGRCDWLADPQLSLPNLLQAGVRRERVKACTSFHSPVVTLWHRAHLVAPKLYFRHSSRFSRETRTCGKRVNRSFRARRTLLKPTARWQGRCAGFETCKKCINFLYPLNINLNIDIIKKLVLDYTNFRILK